MTVPRKQLIDLHSTPYYHVVNRCVRRAFLCGADRDSGKDYQHRRQWIVDKVKALSRVFAMDVCAYAVMSNHYHLVLRVDKDEATHWEGREVLRRWCEVFTGPMLVHAYLNDEPLVPSQLDMVNDYVRHFRARLHDISWFMRCLNESIARQANAEDDCKGRFWEGRFKSQALLDDGALLTCMIYVDLNPIRAGMTERLETSDYTSIQERIFEVAKTLKQARKVMTRSQETTKNKSKVNKHSEVRHNATPVTANAESEFPFKPLLTFIGAESNNSGTGIPFNLLDYFALVEWTGHTVRTDKRGSIPADVKSILDHFSINNDAWIDAVCDFEGRFGYAIGAELALKRYTHNLNRHWLRGKRPTQQLYQHLQAA